MSEARARYHHGDLRNALIDAAVAQARTGGPQAVALRDAARTAGVSHNAGYRHFADRDDLLAAVAERGMAELARTMADQLAQVGEGGGPALAVARLRAAGSGYVRFALADPGLFRTAFAAARWEVVASGRRADDPFGLLNQLLDELAATGAMPAGRRPGAELSAWSAVHGLAGLLVDGPLQGLPAAERDATLDLVLDLVVRGLRA